MRPPPRTSLPKPRAFARKFSEIVPQAICVLPSQSITPKREPDSPNIVDYYAYRTGTREQRFPPDQVIHFRYPDPRDPHTGGSPRCALPSSRSPS